MLSLCQFFARSAISLVVLVTTTIAERTSVTILNGTVKGVRCDGSDVISFLSIPFATAERFAAPEIYNAEFENGILLATKPAVSCPQFSSSSSLSSSENCLFLNVYAPTNTTTSSGLPVKVWIYGGTNEGGSISQAIYTGCYSAVDSLVVSVNYRVGPLGFLALPEANITGNYGLLDQLAALQWVQDNIAAFGGDPTRVMLFGQSAGAHDAFVLSTLPQAPQLMAAAAFESGSGRTLPNTSEVISWNEMFASEVGCNASDLYCLRNASIADMRSAQSAVKAAVPNSSSPTVDTLLENSGKGAAWGPVVDGIVVPTQPVDAGVRIPSIFGSNSEDGSLFVFDKYGSAALSVNTTDYDDFLTSNFGSLADSVQQTFPLSYFESIIPEELREFMPTTFYFAMVTIITYAKYACPTRRALISAEMRSIPVYAYYFDHAPSCAWFSGMKYLDVLGPTHTAEIPFVFGLTRNLPPPSGNCNFTSAEDQISQFMLGAWTHMAATGSPVDNDGSNQWPVWNQSTSMGIQIGDSDISVGYINYTYCDFWDMIDSTISQLDNSGNLTSAASIHIDMFIKNGAFSYSFLFSIIIMICLIF